MGGHFLSVVFAVLGLSCLAVGASLAQDDQPKPQPVQPGAKKDVAPKADGPLTKKEYEELMLDIRGAWNRLNIHRRNRRGEAAAEQADRIAELAPKILRFDGNVLKGDNEGQKARDQEDFRRWTKELQEAAEAFARHARAGDWDAAGAERDKMNRACGGCHDVYEP